MIEIYFAVRASIVLKLNEKEFLEVKLRNLELQFENPLLFLIDQHSYKRIIPGCYWHWSTTPAPIKMKIIHSKTQIFISGRCVSISTELIYLL